jgi:STE24 endopeptidase
LNETKSARYHRLKRRAGSAGLAGTVVTLLAFLDFRPELPVWLYVLALAGANELIALPVALYRNYLLDRHYELSSEPLSTWLADHFKAFAIVTLLAAVGAEILYRVIPWLPTYWWLAAAVGATALTILLAKLAPVILLPIFYKFTPLDRPALTERLMALSTRAGVRVLGVYEWGLGAKTRRANAALVGSGATRRILLSDTLLAEYSEDEIEVILAHEMAHHAHRDIPKGIALEFVLLLAAFYAASVALDAAWRPLGLSGPADVGGLPVLVLAGGAVMLAATPIVNAFSRFNERRADRFALTLTQQRDAFISAMRRLGSQNLAEENPSKVVVWLFHTHPPIEERIAAARRASA